MWITIVVKTPRVVADMVFRQSKEGRESVGDVMMPALKPKRFVDEKAEDMKRRFIG